MKPLEEQARDREVESMQDYRKWTRARVAWAGIANEKSGDERELYNLLADNAFEHARTCMAFAERFRAFASRLSSPPATKTKEGG